MGQLLRLVLVGLVSVLILLAFDQPGDEVSLPRLFQPLEPFLERLAQCQEAARQSPAIDGHDEAEGTPLLPGHAARHGLIIGAGDVVLDRVIQGSLIG